MKKEEFFRTYYCPASMETAELARKLNQEEAEHVLRTADAVRRHSFLFDMEWDMERTYEPLEFGDCVDWEYRPGDDPEFTWQFNRHRFLICLGQAYLMTGDETYAACMLDLMQQFIRSQSDVQEKRQTTWRILEVGIRSANWIKALYLIQNSPLLTGELLDLFYESLKQHGRIIMEEHNPYCYAGNWGVLENHGLYLLGALLPDEFGRACREQAAEVLDLALRMQILPDGVQLEQSPMYHFEVMRCVLEVLLFAKLCGHKLPKTLSERVHDMAMAGLALRKPDGCQLTMGDSDDMSTFSAFALAAYVFEDRVLKWAGSENPGFDNLWLFGAEGYGRYRELTSGEPGFLSKQLYDSGHSVMRSSWQRNADMLHFDGGLLGTSHGHSDTLHVDLILNGTDVLVDPGRYTYVNKAERFELKGTKAHNTVVVDDREFDEWENSWVSRTVSAQSRQRMEEKDGCQFVCAGHTGYMTLENPVWVNRKVIHISPDIYILADECYTSGAHSYQQYFHFDYRGTVALEGKRAEFHGGDANAAFFFDEKCRPELYRTHQSLHYNNLAGNQSICCKSAGDGFHSMVTVCIKDGAGEDSVQRVPVKSYVNQEIQPEAIAEGFKISHHEKKYLVIIGHTEMKGPVTLYQIEDRMGCGNVIVFDLERGAYEGIVLNW